MADELWEILVPARDNEGDKIATEHHRAWDAAIAEITGAEGMTILPPAKGQWTSGSGQLFAEPMIPVRITADRQQIEQIIALTFEHYPDQEAVMAYRISDCVLLRKRSD